MMNDCVDGDMRDRLPDYVHGTLSAGERSVVAAHLARCVDCKAEVELIGAAARAFPAPELDVRRIVAALPGAPRRGARRTFTGHAQRIAAAIGVVVIGAYSAVALRDLMRPAVRPAAPVTPAAGPQPTLVAAAPAPRAVAIDSPAHAGARGTVAGAPVRAGMSFGGGISDLSDDQLDTLLGELDGLDALPSVEPETHLTPILPPPEGGHGAR
jgi:anti-sigma factor RsiW